MRVGKDDYYMSISKTVASRSTCDRKHVGCVIVNNNRILSTGYNGSISGDDHCCDVGCLVVDGHCIRTIHAEVNCIAQAALNGVSVNGGTAYITASPCWNCFKVLANSGIKRIVYCEEYRPNEYTNINEKAKKLGIEFTKLV